jgi:four helix bundle protein
VKAVKDEKGLETLQVWRRSLDFAKRIHVEVLSLLPVEEKWALANQLRRASQSVSANIAEGYGRYYFQEGIRFCYIARGSLEESYSYLILANELGYIPDKLLDDLKDEIAEIKRMLNGYISFLKKSKRGENEPGASRVLREEPTDYQTDLDDIFPDS